ncbi:MAG TPA: hypothetical protein VFX23_11290 [Limnobacter sp.]|uniref:hypothetical protein n=1 Tax=Limnobacter sp. TaxID=2003368 RepID=UPI002E35AFFB|nr:hypothetical protein [Limnobacter sp.]HEX5486568.1 hypothetical protein [Limnobacter sp.]
MTVNTKAKQPLQCILESLGLEADKQTLLNAKKEAFRITFEHNFALELLEQIDNSCRASARICLLGKSLNVQESQISKAMRLFSEVITEAPSAASLAVSSHDNCLRLVKEFHAYDNDENPIEEFEDFLNFGFVFKKTYLESN